MVTIADVAKAANVSVATVSRVINNNNSVSRPTAKRVEAAISVLGYEPNIMARNFRRSESKVILVLTPNIINPFYARIFTGIGTQARKLGYSCMTCTTDGKKEIEKEYLDICKKRQADGAILLATVSDWDEIDKFSKNHPLVQCAEYFKDSNLPHVAVDSYKGALIATRHLIELGHKRIGHISSVNTYQSTKARLDGYRDALNEAGLDCSDELICRGSDDYSFASGVTAAMKLLKHENPPTAIFCISDMLALGAIQGGAEMGRKVPEDLSIVGFDDVEYATTFRPYITTISQPCYELGIQATKLLYDLMQGNENMPRAINLECEIKLRETTAQLKVM